MVYRQYRRTSTKRVYTKQSRGIFININFRFEFAIIFRVGRGPYQYGEVSEWSNELVLKTNVPQGTAGSNPVLSVFQAFDVVERLKKPGRTRMRTEGSLNEGLASKE